MGTAVIGSILVVEMFSGFVDDLANEAGASITPDQRTELSM